MEIEPRSRLDRVQRTGQVSQQGLENGRFARPRGTGEDCDSAALDVQVNAEQYGVAFCVARERAIYNSDKVSSECQRGGSAAAPVRLITR